MLAVYLISAIAILYRFTAIYPSPLGADSATFTYQALQITQGSHPIFFPGQAWMGTAGAYILALMMDVFGANSLTTACFAWLMSSLHFVAVIALAYVLYGSRTALAAAAIFAVPTVRLMYWAQQPRPDYELCFLLIPVLFLLTYRTIGRQPPATRHSLYAALTGLCAGLVFWTNMASGPAVVVSFAALCVYGGRNFFVKGLPWYSVFWCIGASPMLAYNLTHGFVTAEQVPFASPSLYLNRFLDFALVGFPEFWGMEVVKPMGAVYWAFAYIALAGIAFVLLMSFKDKVLGFLKKSAASRFTHGDFLIFGFLIFHTSVTFVSHFGKGSPATHSPLLYMTPLYVAAVIAPAVVIARLRGIKLLCAALPFAAVALHNIYMTGGQPIDFAKTVLDSGFSKVRNFADPANAMSAFCKEKGIHYGYADNWPNKYLNIDCFGFCVFSSTHREHHVARAVSVYAADTIIWHEALAAALTAAGINFNKTSSREGFSAAYNFSKPLWREQPVEGMSMTTMTNPAAALFLYDGNNDGVWSSAALMGEVDEIRINLPRPADISRLIFIPQNEKAQLDNLKVEVMTKDGWKILCENNEAANLFWSGRHPFMTQVKPRMEIALPPHEASTLYRVSWVKTRQQGIYLRELYCYERLDAQPLDSAAYNRELEALLRLCVNEGGALTVVADHWLSNLCAAYGLAVEFISNDTIDDTGVENPHIKALSLNFERRLLFIVPAASAAASQARFKEAGVAYERRDFAFHKVYFTQPCAPKVALTWDGLAVCGAVQHQAASNDYSQLASVVPDSKPYSFDFGGVIKLTRMRLVREKNNVLVFDYEITAAACPPAEYYMFIHGCDGSDAIKFQGDHLLVGPNGNGSLSLAQGQIVAAQRRMKIPADASGALKLRIGIWDPKSGKRLSVNSEHKDFIELPVDS